MPSSNHQVSSPGKAAVLFYPCKSYWKRPKCSLYKVESWTHACLDRNPGLPFWLLIVMSLPLIPEVTRHSTKTVENSGICQNWTVNAAFYSSIQLNFQRLWMCWQISFCSGYLGIHCREHKVWSSTLLDMLLKLFHVL